MKRAHDDDDNNPCHNPVLSQLDFLINGPPKAPRQAEPLAPPLPPLPPLPPPPLLPPLLQPRPITPDPVLAQLDALINGTPFASGAPTATDDEPRGPPGILREFGGVRGWMALHISPKRTTPPGSAVSSHTPSDHTI